MFVYFIRTRTGFEDLVKLLEAECGPDFAVLRPELCFSEKFLRYTLFLAYKSFQDNRASARTIGLEWLCRIAGTGNVSKALGFCLPPKEKGAVAGIACAKKIPQKTLAAAGSEVKTGLKALGKKAAAHFGVTKEALARYPLEDLLIEKAALAGAT
ncbi:MAG: KEOPS complex subunit Cgi121 [Candidatus Micrarchaeota archaeon]|nr:KEOPS complex subunit Cgi121 [Candidatus Micrarchaeota archaeon]